MSDGGGGGRGARGGGDGATQKKNRSSHSAHAASDSWHQLPRDGCGVARHESHVPPSKQQRPCAGGEGGGGGESGGQYRSAGSAAPFGAVVCCCSRSLQASHAHSAWWQKEVRATLRSHEPQSRAPSRQHTPRAPREQNPESKPLFFVFETPSCSLPPTSAWLSSQQVSSSGLYV